MKHRRAQARSDTGAAMVEFAIVFPVLILIVIGIINFGYAWGQQNAVNSAARQGARAAVVEDSPGTGVQGKAQEAVNTSAGPLIEGATVTGVSSATCTVGQNVTVTVSFTDDDGWLASVPPFSGGPKTYTSEATYRCEY